MKKHVRHPLVSPPGELARTHWRPLSLWGGWLLGRGAPFCSDTGCGGSGTAVPGFCPPLRPSRTVLPALHDTRTAPALKCRPRDTVSSLPLLEGLETPPGPLWRLVVGPRAPLPCLRGWRAAWRSRPIALDLEIWDPLWLWWWGGAPTLRRQCPLPPEESVPAHLWKHAAVELTKFVLCVTVTCGCGLTRQTDLQASVHGPGASVSL